MQLQSRPSQASETSPKSKNLTKLDEAALMECSTDENSDESDAHSTSLDRTTSQAASHAQILAVLQRLENRQSSVRQLQELSEQPSKQCWTEEALAASKKKARNLGEDLLEDLLTLDRLSGLRQDDRTKRKAAIAGIEALLEAVDASKKRLSQARVVAPESQTSNHEDSEGDPEKESHILAEPAVSGNLVDAIHLENLILKLSSLDLAANFTSRETLDGYVISASLPYLLRDRLELNLKGERSLLTVKGVCLPSRLEAERMQRTISANVESLARSKPKRLQQLGGCREAAAIALCELGKHKFGSFSQGFRVPTDTDLGRVKASYENGVLEIVLPQKSRVQAHRLPSRFPYNQDLRSGFWGYPAFDW